MIWLDARSTYLALCDLERSKREAIIKNAVLEYADILAAIYNDIYESCIKVFYSTYTPKRYKRHGDITGFNLYSAFASEVTDMRLDAMYLPDELLAYRGVSREDVLNAVVRGQRGTTVRNTPESGMWPKLWVTKYPNAYSRYSIWKSDYVGIEDILTDFDETGAEQTAGLFWDIVAKYL